MRVCVVGGGLAGMIAARALVAEGIDVRVREAAPRAGGVVGTSRIDGFVREHAASSFLASPPDGAHALCEALGVAVEHASPAAKGRSIFLDGKLRALPQSPLAFARSDLLTWRGKLAVLGEPFRAPRGEGRDESMYDFATRRLGTEAARAIIAPFVTGVFAADAHDVSLEAGFPKLAELDADGGLVRGMVKRMFRSRRGPKRPRGMWAPVGGLGALVDALAANLGDRLELAEPVARVAPRDGGVMVDDDAYDGAVLAGPAADMVSLVPDMPELATRLGVFARSPVALVYLGYPTAQVPLAREGFGFLVAQGESLRVLGVVFESVVWSNRAPAGMTLLRCIFGGGRDPSATELDDAALIAQARRDVGVALEASGEPVHASVVRWARGLAQYPLGHRAQVDAAMVAARSRRLVLAGADYRGAGVNDLCADAAVIVREVKAWGG